ncbi:MAG TPA: ATP-binding protein [Candidatus Saccharimonadales bacterium]|nr:ATP-binding protein [Candidatus Saccharimonadales bacterium]
MGFLLFVVFLIIVAAVILPLAFVRTRGVRREQKNIERGLKMVPLLIHLPPPSDDIEGGGRDRRDVVDENISRAQIIYNIIASTFQKGFKNQFYGQRHFSFEIVGSKGFVYFYAAVPVIMVDVVRQAIVSAYPTARLEEVAEHNIFNQVGKLSGTSGGELTLKESFAYPIATYQDLKRDTMQSLLNALSTLEKEDGAAIQILIRPANPGWRKTAAGVASSKRKGEESKKGMSAVGAFSKQVLMAPVKPPEEKKDEPKQKPELSNLDQNILDAIDDKTRYPGFEVLVRVVVSSNISQRAQTILSNIVATFSLFDAPGRNGFKYVPAKSIEKFTTNYILRIFPQAKNKTILNTIELATLFHFPDQSNVPTSQLSRQESKQVDGPRNIPDKGLLLGYNVFRGVNKPIRLDIGDRQRHMYVVGQTGTGKSTFLENLALQDMLAGNGFAFVDPHGDTAEKLLAMVPKERTEDLIYFSPADTDYPMGLNLFEFHSDDQKDFIIQEVLNMLYKLYDPQHQGIMGPRYEDMFRNAALAVMADPAGGTFIEIPQLFRDPQFLKQKLQHVKDRTVLDFWQKQFPASQRSNDAGEVTAWFVSKFGAFLSNEMMRNIIGQTKSSFDLRDIMDNKKILLVNLSKGRTGDLNSKLLGMIFVMKFQAAAMSRANIPENERVDFSLYVDEFQNFSTESFATIMSEARKYHLNLIVANQFTTQLTPEIRDAVFGNMGTIVSFRIGQNDVESLVQYFQPAFESEDLLRVPNYNTITRTLVGGVPTQPFSMATLPPLGNPNNKLAEALKQLSAAKYGKPRAVVEKDIFARLETKMTPTSAFGRPAGVSTPTGGRFGTTPRPGWNSPMQGPFDGRTPGPAGMMPTGPGGPARASSSGGSSSFLDEWLNKRRPTGGAQPASSTAGSMPVPEPLSRSNTAIRNARTAAYEPIASADLHEPSISAPQMPHDLGDSRGSNVPSHDNAEGSEKQAPHEPRRQRQHEKPSRNISSDEIERNEIDEIARELKKKLKADTPITPEQANDQGQTPGMSSSPKSDDQQQPKPKLAPEAADDTIFIDPDGTLHIKQDT